LRARLLASATTTKIGIGLIGANYHFLSDVIARGFVGVSSGWMLTSPWKAHDHFRHSNRQKRGNVNRKDCGA